MKLFYKILLALLLIAIPVAGRWLWFNRGQYSPPSLAEVDDLQVVPPLPDYHAVTDQPEPGEGLVIIDLAHENNLEVNDLAPLRDRLEARGVAVDNYDSETGTPLEEKLRGATALVAVAPTTQYSTEEQEVIEAFVEDGGRLLLAADPTRQVPAPPEDTSLFAVFFPASAIPAINSLANPFGIVYLDDYLYNLVDNEGNYRNVKLVDFNDTSPLTRDLETVVFFASHSLRSNGAPLISGDDNTLSPVRRGETDLTAAALAAKERVLALGDVTFLTPSYHTVADNDLFLSHIADWLAGAARQRDLEDFPYLFDRPVDLVQVTGEYLDPRLVAGVQQLQETFEEANLALTVRAETEPDHDALFVGTFDDTAPVQDYLATAGISITVLITPTEEITEAEESEDEEPTTDNGEPTATVTPTITATLSLTDTPETGAQTEPGSEETSSLDTAEDTLEEKGPKGFVEIEELGTIQIEGTSLFVVDRSAEKVVVTVLGEDSETVVTALSKLASGDMSGCLVNDPVTVCSTGVTQETTDSQTETGEAPPGSTGEGASIFILSDDDSSQGQRTGAAEFQEILGSVYQVTVWSTSQDGLPTQEDVAGYDVYIIDSGDYAYDLEDSDTLVALSDIQDGNVMFIGQQPFPSFDPEPAAINDLEITDTSHPIAYGLAEEETITLGPTESGVPAVIIPPAPEVYGEADIIFTRGPNSPEAGRPAVIAATTDEGGHIILASFAFYRLPEEVQRNFALNVVKWLLEQ